MGSITKITRGWYEAKSLSKKSAEVFIFGEIASNEFNGVTAKTFTEDVKALGDIKNLTVKINSPGGSVTEGLAILTFLHELQDSGIVLTTKIMGVAASMASAIFMAGDVRIMPLDTILMIHRPTAGQQGDF